MIYIEEKPALRLPGITNLLKLVIPMNIVRMC